MVAQTLQKLRFFYSKKIVLFAYENWAISILKLFDQDIKYALFKNIFDLPDFGKEYFLSVMKSRFKDVLTLPCITLAVMLH